MPTENQDLWDVIKKELQDNSDEHRALIESMIMEDAPATLATLEQDHADRDRSR